MKKLLNMKNLFKEPKQRNLNHWKFFTVAMGLLLISMLALAQRYERAIYVTVFTLITYVLISIKEKQKTAPQRDINKKNP
jgi:phage-related protein